MPVADLVEDLVLVAELVEVLVLLEVQALVAEAYTTSVAERPSPLVLPVAKHLEPEQEVMVEELEVALAVALEVELEDLEDPLVALGFQEDPKLAFTKLQSTKVFLPH